MAANRTAVGRLPIVAVIGAVIPISLISAAGWWFTAPLESPAPAAARPDESSADATTAGPRPAPLAEWPAGRLDGREAKRYLLAFMEQAVRRLDRVDGYTAVLTRQERIGGELGPEQRLRIKIQHEPFAVFLRFEAPNAGKEVLFHEGRFEDHLLAHNGDWTRRLIPRFKLDPHGPIALADNRHPITEAGLAHLSRKLLQYRKLDLDDPHAETILDRSTDEDGRLWYRSVHTHSTYTDERPFAYVEIRYCPDLLLPLQIESYDWPEPCCDLEDVELAERYHYSDIDLDVSFSALDFDPTNPEYGFQRY
ncbi:DUF1571 domain-containing protein [Tautonia plasticadhaerens]|uniref:DUF1571 domain-containing protein n=1 Tax=Tautonia plasticadhaerens TaxID=2527974 RepID=A0A518GXS8_9BACT|nr:DUF1571 domain-containing protein [Tautonia plasticadhaerens]QDV33373.1 hypothetical protein ElP_12440 [Tautonia plasticadhaerens]